MTDDRQPGFVTVPSADHPGWLTFEIDSPDIYNSAVIGPMIVRKEPAGGCRLRCFPQPHLSNLNGAIHGGALLGVIDISLFAAVHVLSTSDAVSAVTLDLSNQFIGAGQLDRPLDAVVEILRETGRLVFIRGLLEQDGTLVAAFNGTVRKGSPRA